MWITTYIWKKKRKIFSWLKKKPFKHKELNIYQLHSSLNQYRFSKKEQAHAIRFTDDGHNHSTSRISIKKTIDEVKILEVTGSNKFSIKKEKSKVMKWPLKINKNESLHFLSQLPCLNVYGSSGSKNTAAIYRTSIIFNKPSTTFKKSLVLDMGNFLHLQLFCIHMFQASLEKSIFSLKRANLSEFSFTTLNELFALIHLWWIVTASFW